MELSEFRALIDACRKNDSDFIKYTGSAFFIFQFHMIARLDDVFRFRSEDITRNIEFPFALKSKMRWSKNVLEERDAPDRRMVDTYIDNSIPYPDAKVAAILCIGGAVKYSVRTGTNINSDFILTHVCPNIKNTFPREVSLVLGTALLWEFYDDGISQIFPQDIVDAVKR